MNLVVILLAVIAICICIGVANDSDKTEESQKAKRPEALAKLLSEEFPAFSSSFTYAGCQQALGWSESFSGSVQIGNHLTFGGEVKPQKAQELGMLLSSALRASLGDAFSAHIAQNPAEGAFKIIRAINASKLLAKA